jgi:hypothetical protein
VDKATWNTILVAAVPLVLGLSIYSLVLAQPRRQVLLPFLPSLAASIAIYMSMVDGASSFHDAVVLCTLLALSFALFLVLAQPWREKLAAFSWALLGVVTPYVLFIGLIAAACWGHTECFG